MRAVVILLALVALYFGGRVGVRKWVDHKIETSVDQPLPAIAWTTTDGRTLRTEEWKGKRVVLNFARSHCGSCVQEEPAIREFAASLDPADTVLITVLTDKVMSYPEADTAATVARCAYTHPIALADESTLDAFHGAEWAQVTPITYVADRNGVVRVTLRGTQTAEALRTALQRVK